MDAKKHRSHMMAKGKGQRACVIYFDLLINKKKRTNIKVMQRKAVAICFGHVEQINCSFFLVSLSFSLSAFSLAV